MKQSLIYALGSALITAAIILGTPAFAQEAPSPGETYVSLVPTGDLDLNTETGRRVLDVRLARAAREVCGTASDVDLEGKNLVRKCRAEAIARAAAGSDTQFAATEGFIAVTASR